MARCHACQDLILFGGVRQRDQHYCDAACAELGTARRIIADVPQDYLSGRIDRIHRGSCHVCGGAGPIDVHIARFMWSFVIFVFPRHTAYLCCRSCAIKKQLVATLGTFLLGWWALPLGIIGTPWLIGRNLLAIAFPPTPSRPSRRLNNIVELDLAQEIISRDRRASAAQQRTTAEVSR